MNQHTQDMQKVTPSKCKSCYYGTNVSASVPSICNHTLVEPGLRNHCPAGYCNCFLTKEDGKAKYGVALKYFLAKKNPAITKKIRLEIDYYEARATRPLYSN